MPQEVHWCPHVMCQPVAKLGLKPSALTHKPVSLLLQTVTPAERSDWGHIEFLGLVSTHRWGLTPAEPTVLIGSQPIVTQVPVPLHWSPAPSRRGLPENVINSTGWRVGTGQGSIARPRGQKSQCGWSSGNLMRMPSCHPMMKPAGNPRTLHSSFHRSVVRLKWSNLCENASHVPCPEQAENQASLPIFHTGTGRGSQMTSMCGHSQEEWRPAQVWAWGRKDWPVNRRALL